MIMNLRSVPQSQSQGASASSSIVYTTSSKLGATRTSAGSEAKTKVKTKTPIDTDISRKDKEITEILYGSEDLVRRGVEFMQNAKKFMDLFGEMNSLFH
jgi:hypothetical protein